MLIWFKLWFKITMINISCIYVIIIVFLYFRIGLFLVSSMVPQESIIWKYSNTYSTSNFQTLNTDEISVFVSYMQYNIEENSALSQ